MNDDNNSESTKNRLITELISIIPKDTREMIGEYAGIYIFIFTPMIMIGGLVFIMNILTSEDLPEVPCWEIQKVEDRIFKINTCTGESVEIPPQNTKVNN
jgi:hypothetical protein